MMQTAFVLSFALAAAPQVPPPADAASPEAAIVQYLQANVKPGQPVVVSTLFNEVFTGAPERKALNRLFNTFFKIPLFVVQVQQATGHPPSLQHIS